VRDASVVTERDHLRLLLETARACVSTLDLPELVDAISSALARVVPHEFAALALHEERTGGLVVHTVASKSDDAHEHVVKRFPGGAVGLRETLMGSVCSVPLVVADHELGTFTVGHLEPDAFSPAAVAIIEAVGRQVATSVASRVAFQEVARLREDLAELRRSRRPADDDHRTATLEDVERMHILRVLDETNWTLAGPQGAAARLGMKRTTLQSLMRRLGIARPRAA